MKNFILTITAIFVFAFGLLAQDKEIEKCQDYYESGKYEKCIKQADKYLSDDRSLKELYIFKGLSNFALYEQSGEIRQLNDALRDISLAEEKKNEYEKEYPNAFAKLHKACRKTADDYYSKDKENISERYYKYLVDIYQDTTAQYMDIFIYSQRPDGEIVKQMEAGELNQTDEQGRKQGSWKKVYPTGVVAYEVSFKDDKPQGTMVRYHPNGNKMAELEFDKTGEYAAAKLFDEDGQLIAEGFYDKQEKDSLWKYYRKDVLVQSETYKNGVLHGDMKAYYPNGAVFDIRHFENGNENGIWERRYSNGNIQLKGMVKDNTLEGNFMRYFIDGSIEEKGQYHNNKKTGVWDYYTEDGKMHNIEYKAGVAENDNEIERKQSEKYQEEIQNRLKDPENFKNNPYEYIND